MVMQWSTRENELYHKLIKIIEDGDYSQSDVMNAILPMIGHTVEMMSAHGGEEQKQALEWNIKAAVKCFEEHARINCACTFEKGEPE